MTENYVHLHVHSHFSFLDGASAPEALAGRAAELGQSALALTDWHGVYGAIEHRLACERAGIRPLYGADGNAAWRAARWLRDRFGDDLWIELPLNEREDDRPLALRLAGVADRLGVGVVATANVHYATPAQATLADTLACIREGTTL